VDIWERLAADQTLLRGFDMEASVIGLAGFLHDTPWIVVKGVMDFGEPGRTQGFRKFAARAAAEVLLGFLREHVPSDEPETARRILKVLEKLLQNLHDLDDEIRATLAPLTEFDDRWSSEDRSDIVNKLHELASRERFLRNVRNSHEQLAAERDRGVALDPDSMELVHLALACGKSALDAVGRSTATPWPAPEALSELIAAIKQDAKSNDRAAAVAYIKNQAKTLHDAVNREQVGKLDGLLGRFRAAVR
jgi:hypothetical protein